MGRLKIIRLQLPNRTGHGAQKGFSYIIQSEPDKGIYDAMNKGVRLASGTIVGILNSDDCYAASDVLSSVLTAFEENHTETAYGNLMYVKNNKPYRYWKSGKYVSFKYGWMPPHPSFFVRKDAYEKYGMYRFDCGVNADYELMLRFLEKEKASTVWIDRVLVKMAAGGASGNGLKSRAVGMRNDHGANPFEQLTMEEVQLVFNYCIEEDKKNSAVLPRKDAKRRDKVTNGFF